MVQGGTIAYVGADDGARALRAAAAEVDLRGRLVTPAFVDAHLHAVQAGLVAAGLDLHDAASRTDVLDRLAAYAARRPDGVILGQGWDERAWPDPRPPTRAELDRAGGGRLVYLARVDVHSAVVSTAVLDRLPGIADAAGFGADGLLTREAHHRGRGCWSTTCFPTTTAATAARWTLRRAARLGVASVHELGGPHLGPLADLIRVREAGAELGLDVVTYWGELAVAGGDRPGPRGRVPPGWPATCASTGRSAPGPPRCTPPYADAEHRGARYLDDDEIADHVVACTRAGLQAGFHCIGDDAVAAAVAGLRRAADRARRRAGPARRGTGWSTWSWWRPTTSRRWPSSGWWPACSPRSTPRGGARASCTRPGWGRSGRRP